MSAEPIPAAAPATRVSITLEALDTLVFRDARPFDAAARANSVEPMPQTLTGAVRTFLMRAHGVDFAALKTALRDHGGRFLDAAADLGGPVGDIARVRIRGPWFAKDGKPLVAAPTILQTVKDDADKTASIRRLVPMDPADVPGYRDDHGLMPLWHCGSARLERAAGLIDLDGLAAVLAGGIPENLVASTSLHGIDRRTGIVVDPATGTTGQGLIYALGRLALKDGVTLVGEVDGPADILAPLEQVPLLLPLGGETRHVVVRAGDPIAWPRPARSARKLVVLTSPGLFREGWKPEGLDVRAASVPTPLPVSGWDLSQGGPKANRFAVPPGACWFIDGDLPASAVETGSLADDPEDAAVGWGTFVVGEWNA